MSQQREEALFSRQSIKAALECCTNWQKLSEHPLTTLKIVEKRRRAARYDATPRAYGLALKQLLEELIAEFKPSSADEPFPAKCWRSYFILNERYLKDRSIGYIMDSLAIRKGTFHTARNEACEALAIRLKGLEEGCRPQVEHTSRPFLAPPRAAHQLVGRDELLRELKQQLFAKQQIALAALNGLPGVGKTALALALVYDKEVLAHFTDGILWAGLGRQPDLLALLGTWGSALGMSQQELGKLNGINERAKAIHRAIGMRQMLLVIDDAWQSEAALTFRLGGPNCACLLTTRQLDIALDFAGPAMMKVRELSDGEGLALLKELAPNAVAAEPDAARELVQAVGGLPLAIILMGRYLRKVAYNRRRLRNALEQLKKTSYRLQLEQPAPLEEPAMSLQASIEISDNALDESARQALRVLSLFPPKPNTFSEEAALAVAAADVTALDSLVDAGLLESSASRYTLHQAIADYAALRHNDEEGCERMVTFFVHYTEAHQKELDALDIELDNIEFALQKAHQGDMKSLLVRGTNALCHFWDIRGLYAQAERHLEQALKGAKRLEDGTFLLTTWLNLGRIAQKQGNYAEAKAYLQHGLTLAEALENEEQLSALLWRLGTVEFHSGTYKQAKRYLQKGLLLAQRLQLEERICALLIMLGTVTYHCGAYDEAQRHYQQGLALARQLKDDDNILTLLGNLGAVAYQHQTYEQAEAYYAEGLALARALGHREKICHLLANLGNVLPYLGDYFCAEAYLHEGLQLARRLGHPEKICYLLQNLATVLAYRKQYEQAAACFEEALSIAQALGHGWLTSVTLIKRGNFHLKQSDWGMAEADLRAALEIAQEIGAKDYLAKAYFRLAQVTYGQGDVAVASQQAQKSLQLFEQLAHQKAASVKAWLAALP